MIAVCDMGPLHYLVLIGYDHVLPQLFDRVVTARVVIEKEMTHPSTPEPVRQWAASPPAWLEVIEPKQVVSIPSLGKEGSRGDGDRAVISLAREQEADFVVMDDIRARKELTKHFRDDEAERKPQLLWMLNVLDEAAERGLIKDLSETLDHLEHRTDFYVGDKARVAIEGMKRRDLQRRQGQGQTLREQDKPTEGRTPRPGDDDDLSQRQRHRRRR